MLPIFASFFLIGSSIAANKALLFTLPPILFVGIRMTIAGLVVVAMKSRTYIRRGLHRIWQDAGILAITSGTNLVMSLSKAYAYKNSFSSKIAFLCSIDPFVTAFYAYILFGDRLSWKQLIGVCIGFLGTSVLIFQSSPLESTLKAFSIFSWPELAAIFSVFVGRYGWIKVQQLLRTERYQPLEINGINMTLTGVACLFAAWGFHETVGLNFTVTSSTFGLLGYSIIAGNIIGFGIFAYVLKHYNITFVSLAGFTVPIIVSILGFIFFDEPMSLGLGIAAATIFAGLFLFYYDELRGIKHSGTKVKLQQPRPKSW
ncbi:DMT family transporter [bacterium]|nr:DMT family transporter [bacterium]